MTIPSFHDVRFPISISRGAKGGPERKTDILTLGSGVEHRNARHAHSRRRWNAGCGVKSLDSLHRLVSFFEERRGRLYGFRWQDPIDFKSCLPSHSISPIDQELGIGDGVNQKFPLSVCYGMHYAPYRRPITKPLISSLRVALNGIEKKMKRDVIWDEKTSRLYFLYPPPTGTVVTAGFLFDTPARFDVDSLEIDMVAFQAGQLPNIPLVEIIGV
jgi:uncharacterized protein (TIGR02217 family)